VGTEDQSAEPPARGVGAWGEINWSNKRRNHVGLEDLKDRGREDKYYCVLGLG